MDICGGDGIYIPSTECDECEAFLSRLSTVENNVSILWDDVQNKQDELTAGDNISIINNVISSTGGGSTYTAGDGITILNDVISALRNPTNTYTKAEVDELISGVAGLRMEVVTTLPTTGENGVIYLIERSGGGYEQWVYTQTDGWIDLGGEDIDLSGYLKKTDGATDAPLMDGTAAVGTAQKYAREDHRHPTDTTRAPLASPAFTGTPTTPNISGLTTSTTQIANAKFVQDAIKNRFQLDIYNDTATHTFEVPTGTDVFMEVDELKATEPGYKWGYVRVSWPANANGRRFMEIQRKRGTEIRSLLSVDSRNACQAGPTHVTLPFITYLRVGDVIRINLWQNSGSSLNANVIFGKAVGFNKNE